MIQYQCNTDQQIYLEHVNSEHNIADASPKPLFARIQNSSEWKLITATRTTSNEAFNNSKLTVLDKNRGAPYEFLAMNTTTIIHTLSSSVVSSMTFRMLLAVIFASIYDVLDLCLKISRFLHRFSLSYKSNTNQNTKRIELIYGLHFYSDRKYFKPSAWTLFSHYLLSKHRWQDFPVHH